MQRAERANAQPFAVALYGGDIVWGPAVNWIPRGRKSLRLHAFPQPLSR